MPMERSPIQHVFSSPCLKILFTWKSCLGLNQYKIHPIGKDMTKLETFLIQSNISIMDDIQEGYASFLETHSNCHSNIPLSFKDTETSWDDQLTKVMGKKSEQTFPEHQLSVQHYAVMPLEAVWLLQGSTAMVGFWVGPGLSFCHILTCIPCMRGTI